MNNDLIKGELTNDQKQAILQLLGLVREKMPFLINLSVDERRSLPKMGDKSRAFVDQGLVVASQNPEILPGIFDIDEYRRDIALSKQLEPAARQLHRRRQRCLFANLVGLSGGQTGR